MFIFLFGEKTDLIRRQLRSFHRSGGSWNRNQKARDDLRTNSVLPSLMPHMPSENLRLVPDKNLLFPKFQSYKLQAYSEEESLRRISLPIAPSRPTLPNNARVGFQDVRVRTNWNHLSHCWDGKSVLYVGINGEI